MNQTKEMDRTIRSLKQKKYNKKMNVKFKTVKLNRSLKKNKKIKDGTMLAISIVSTVLAFC